MQSDAYIALDERRQCRHAKGGERPCAVRGNALFPPNTSLSGPSVRYSLSILFFSFQKKKLWTSEQSFIITKMTRSNGRLEPEVIVNVRLKYNEKKKEV